MNNRLKAFVRYNQQGKLVEGPIFRASKPTVGNWHELASKICCTTTTTTAASSYTFVTFRADGSNAFNSVLMFPTENVNPLIVDWGDGSAPEAFYNNSKKKGGFAYFLSHDYTGVVADCDITFSMPLTDCIYMGLSSNDIITPPILTDLTALQTLYLSYTSITDPPVLTGLTALQYLDLSYTPITTPPDLTGLTALQRLYLNSTPITTPPDLTGLTALQALYLSYTPLDVTDVDIILGYFAILYQFCTYVNLQNTAIPTPATLLTAQNANPQCNFVVDA
jgi:hypothetical protein